MKIYNFLWVFISSFSVLNFFSVISTQWLLAGKRNDIQVLKNYVNHIILLLYKFEALIFVYVVLSHFFLHFLSCAVCCGRYCYVLCSTWKGHKFGTDVVKISTTDKCKLPSVTEKMNVSVVVRVQSMRLLFFFRFSFSVNRTHESQMEFLDTHIFMVIVLFWMIQH